jgi:hypothetical protein
MVMIGIGAGARLPSWLDEHGVCRGCARPVRVYVGIVLGQV